MSTINFRETGKSYAGEFQRLGGFGFETRYYRVHDLDRMARDLGWHNSDELYCDGVTLAEALITSGVVVPYRVVPN